MDSALINVLQDDNWGEYSKLINSFKHTRQYELLLEALITLKRDILFVSPVHGQGHIERTMMHASIAAWKNDLDEQDFRILLLMASYHDVGRISDWLDELHGLRSANMLQEIVCVDDDTLNMMKACIDAHSRPDSELVKTLEKYPVLDGYRTLYLAKLLKDSDGLDRVRVGDLDTKYLRYKASKEMADFSAFFFDKYVVEEKRLGVYMPRKDDYYLKDFIKVYRDCITTNLLDGKGPAETAYYTLCSTFNINEKHEINSKCYFQHADFPCSIYMGTLAFITRHFNNLLEKYKKEMLFQYKSINCGRFFPGGKDRNSDSFCCFGTILDITLFTYKFIKENT